jgi:nucleotide-binding universal stress UspA family protein
VSTSCRDPRGRPETPVRFSCAVCPPAETGYAGHMGTVICCVDDSDGARSALHVAGRLAERLDLDLVLLHVQPPTEAPGVSAATAGQERLREAEMHDAAELLGRIARDHGLGSDVRQRVQIGSAADSILDVCADEGAELVVLGSRGRGGLKAALLGSVSTKVAAHAPCPCVIVPPDAGKRIFLA